jgi:hypothetical protein
MSAWTMGMSKIKSLNQAARFGSIAQIPSSTEIKEFAESTSSQVA